MWINNRVLKVNEMEKNMIIKVWTHEFPGSDFQWAAGYLDLDFIRKILAIYIYLEILNVSMVVKALRELYLYL